MPQVLSPLITAAEHGKPLEPAVLALVRVLGFDSFISSMADQNETDGVVVHLAEQGNPNSSDLLDMTPLSSYFDWNDVALVVGATYSDPDAGLSITTESVTNSGATVRVSLSQPSCVRALPTISVSPSQAGPVFAGTTVNYTVFVANNDSSSCGASTCPRRWTTT